MRSEADANVEVCNQLMECEDGIDESRYCSTLLMKRILSNEALKVKQIIRIKGMTVLFQLEMNLT